MTFLLLEKGCVHCSNVKVKLDMNKFEDDLFTPKTGEKIFLFQTSTAEGTKIFSERFECQAVAPILKTSDGKELIKVDEILAFLRGFGYLKQ